MAVEGSQSHALVEIGLILELGQNGCQGQINALRVKKLRKCLLRV